MLYFEQSRFTVCSEPGGNVQILSFDSSGTPLRSFSNLQQVLGPRGASVAFAMNAGMFDENGRPIGLLIEGGKQLHKVNRHSGGGNFGLLPNGIFLVRDSGKSDVVQTSDFEASGDIAYATQSGPMLVIDGTLHPKFDADGESRNLRNGVGIGPDDSPLFVISDDPVSFGKFARLFRDQLKAKNALYFDGAVSSLWSPADGRQDVRAPLGPLVVVFTSAESAPGREGRARP
jgi:uncharacterized protein YigE (DUF2233 family)